MTAPTAPHSNLADGVFTEPLPARRHEDLFKNVIVPRRENFNPESVGDAQEVNSRSNLLIRVSKPSGVSWIKGLPRQNQTNVEYNDHFYRQRLRALQAVDELVDGLFGRLEQHGILQNTYV